MPVQSIPVSNDLWQRPICESLRRPLQRISALGVECKCSALYGLRDDLHAQRQIRSRESRQLYDKGLQSLNSVEELIACLWEALVALPSEILLLGSVADKRKLWQRFWRPDYDRWRQLKGQMRDGAAEIRQVANSLARAGIWVEEKIELEQNGLPMYSTPEIAVAAFVGLVARLRYLTVNGDDNKL